MSNWTKFPTKENILKDIMEELGYRYVSDFAKDLGFTRQTSYNVSWNKWVSKKYFDAVNNLLIKKGKEPKTWAYYLK